MIYEFHPDAEEEFIEAAAYCERNVPSLGERFAHETYQAIEQLLKYPEIGSPIDPNLRRIVLTRFPYWKNTCPLNVALCMHLVIRTVRSHARLVSVLWLVSHVGWLSQCGGICGACGRFAFLSSYSLPYGR